MKILDLGCGNNKFKGAIGIDINSDSEADIICDLDHPIFPLKDNSFDMILCFDILEHLDDLIKAIEEIHRIAKTGALVKIRVPFMSSVNYFTDPTHKRAFTSRSFDFFIPGTKTFAHKYSKARFSLISVEYNSGEKRRFLVDTFLQKLANKYKDVYENRFSYFYPLNEIYFVLKVEK